MTAYLKSIDWRALGKRLSTTAIFFFLMIVVAGLCYLCLTCYFVVSKATPIISSLGALVFLWVAWDIAKPDEDDEWEDEEPVEKPRIDINQCIEPGCPCRRNPPGTWGSCRYICPEHQRKWKIGKDGGYHIRPDLDAAPPQPGRFNA